MDRVRQIAFIDHSVLAFTGATFLLAPLALGPKASLGSIALLLSVLLVYFPILLRKNTFNRLLILWLALTIARCSTWIGPSLNALSSPWTSLLSSFMLSGITCFIALATLFASAWVRVRKPAIYVTVFPALWATVWWIVSSISPFGRLFLWSPVAATQPYDWILQLFGPIALDWLTAAWAVFLAYLCELWYMKSDETLIPLADGNDHQSSSQSISVAVLAAFLLVCVIPSFIITADPLPVQSNYTTPFGVGCILPPKGRYKRHTLKLEDYLKETRRFASSSKLLLWPESAVTFQDEEERDAAFKEIHKIEGPIVGVSFNDASYDGNKRSAVRQNGFALISTDKRDDEDYVKLRYHKRNIVPIAESFSMRHSSTPPSIYTLDLRSPRDVTDPDWAPPPNHTRPIPLTASICLDFAMPLPFNDLRSKPALILAPARTWDRSIGHLMWRQAVQRAHELDTMILWCDGGDGGFSGVAGRGFEEAIQVGEGSWVRNIAIQYPFDHGRSTYALIGDWPCLATVWLLVIIAAAAVGPQKYWKGKKAVVVPTGDLIN